MMSRARPYAEFRDLSDISVTYEDEFPPEVRLVERRGGGGEAQYYTSEDDYSFIDYNLPTEQGDYNQPSAAFYNVTHVNEVDLPFYALQETSSDDEDAFNEDLRRVEDNALWLGDSDGDSTLRHRSNAELDVTDSEDEESYVSVNRFLSNDDPRRDDWYEDPRGEDFRAAFSCLRNRKHLAKKYLLDILSTGNEEDDELCDQVDLDPGVQDEVTFALSELLIPGLAKLSVEKLCDLLVKYPTLDLRGYLVDMDVFYIAYIIWGIDYYMNKKYGGYIEADSSSSVSYEEEKPRLAESLKKCWRKSVGWLFESNNADCKNEVYPTRK